MNFDYDLLIVGGSLVGGSLALALKGLPLRIAVIESIPDRQRIESAAGDRALALSFGSVQVLRQLGVWDQVKLKATPIRHIHVSDRGHFGKVRMSAEKEGVPALGYVATARVLEQAICEQLGHSGIDVICPARLMGVDAGNQGVHVSLKRGEESITLSARLLVGSDGGNSTVRTLLGIGQHIHDYGQAGIVTEVTTAKANRFTAYERFTSSGPLAFLPMGPKRSSVVWTQTHEDAQDLLAESDDTFRDRLQSSFGWWLGRISLASSRQAFPLKLIRAEKMAAERVVLIGNAMHQLHPVAGQGFNLGLRDVALLAEMLAAKMAFSGDIGEREFLEMYAQARLTDLSAVVQFTDSMVGIFSNDFMPVAAARNLGLLAVDHCAYAKRMLTQYAMGLWGRVPRFN